VLFRSVIVGFRRDALGDWVADLSCSHSQHVRHQAPFRLAPWVLDDAEREARRGSPLDCPPCDRAELPEQLDVVRRTEVWDERSMPAALRRAHRLHVQEGRLRLVAQTRPPLELEVGTEAPQAIPPDVEHRIEPLGPVRFFVEFLRR
jgi:tellurite methyltransferase